MELKRDFLQELEPRLQKWTLWMAMVVAAILLRLVYLQGVRGHFYHIFSEENSIREIVMPAARGRMWDRNGNLLADNRPAFDLVVIPQYVIDPEAVFAALHQHLEIPNEVIRAQWEKRKRLPPFKPIPIWQDVSQDIVAWVKARKSPWGKLPETVELRGVDILLRYEREYFGGDIASHVLGYVREIDAERLKAYQAKWPGIYQPGDAIGVRGLEEVWDQKIRGEDGYQQKVVNAVGREIVASGLEDELTEKKAVHGGYLRLTLDGRLQKAARDFFQGKSGAAVALDPTNGAVLLLYSAPSFDLNQFDWEAAAASPKKYLLNRAIQGAYPLGSVYKIITAAAALHEKKVQPSQTFYCGGAFYFGGRPFHCWRKAGHGVVALQRGLIESCDVYFYNLGLKVGVDGLAKYALAFGLGEETEIGLANERSGLVPTREWKQKARGDVWHEGETLSVAIGQGANLATPLQAARMIAMVANGGQKIKPYLVESVIHPKTGEEKKVKRLTPAPSAILAPEILAQVKQALVGVVANPSGTAHRLHALGIPMGGKTGTAQVVALGRACVGEACRDHAWFVAFAPAEAPKIAVAVLVEHGGHGSSGAAPLAGELIQIYLKNEKENL